MNDFEEINLIGLEIEGRWEQLPERGIPADRAPVDPETERRDRKNLMYDGSVEFEGVGGRGNLGNTIDKNGPKIGEAVSEPLPPDRAVSWLEDVYPPHVNDTCGLHVHFSFPPPYYQRLMDDEFWKMFVREADQWGRDHDVPDRYFNRLAGNNTTCRDWWDPDRQVNGGHDTRYAIWNFHAYRSHGTTECRLMPAFDSVALAKESVLFLCDVVCRFLRNHNPKPVIIDAKPVTPETRTKTI